MPVRPLLAVASAALAASLGCAAPAGAPHDPPQPAAGVQALVERAADLEGVPRPLLVAIAWIDARMSMNGGAPSRDGGYGLFHLVDAQAPAADDQSGPAGGAEAAARAAISLQQASRLTGIPAEALRRDPLANARGGAALLRAQMDRLLAEYPDLREEQLGHWFQAVMRLSGATDARVADAYASQVYRLLQGGLSAESEGGPVRIVPQEVALAGAAIWGELSQDLSGQYCPAGACVAFVPAANFTAARVGGQVTTVVIHDMEGDYASSITYFQQSTTQASAHYLIRSSDGQITQMVRDEDTAWHSGNHAVNEASIGIEHEGFAHTGTQWFTEAMYRASAALVRWIADTYRIPRDRTHVIGHYEVPDLGHAGWYGGANHHHDPCDAWNGDPTWHNNTACYWDWAHYMDLVNGTGATGTLTGFVGDACCGIAAGTRKPLPGATVTLQGTAQSTTTAADGTYSFSLPAGTWTPVAGRSGYDPGDHSSLGAGYPAALTVAAGQTTWGSIVLKPAVTPVPTKPLVAIARPAGGSAATATPVAVAGTVDDRSLTAVRINGVSYPASGGAFAGQADLIAGANTITVTATNAAGTGRAQVTVTYAPPSTGVAGKVQGTGAVPVAGAAVRLMPGSHGSVSAADGRYTISAPPGAYTLSTDAGGYQPLSQPVTVPAAAVVALDLQLVAAPAPPAAHVRIDQPGEGQSFTDPNVMVAGQAEVPDLASVSVAGEQVGFATATGAFSAQVLLQPGSNAIVVVATDRSGKQVSATVDAIYAPPPAPSGGCQSVPATASALAGVLALWVRRRTR